VVGVMLAPLDGRALLWDYVPWEQMSKQRRGVMWSLQLARTLNRQLVLPPLRFLTSSDARRQVDDPDLAYDYRAYSHVFDIEPLRKLHPVVDLHDFLHRNDSSGSRIQPRIDLIFSILRGVSPRLKGVRKQLPLWDEGDCASSLTMANPGQADCAIEGSGEEICVTPVAFAGTTLRALNHSCGWAPEMRFDRLLQAREARELPAVALQGIIYQLPPPSSMRPLAEARAQLAADGEGCGWHCPYNAMRLAMLYQPRYTAAARRFLEAVRAQHAPERGAVDDDDHDDAHEDAHDDAKNGDDPAASDRAANELPRVLPRVLGVHWRRGDFAIQRAGQHETECSDVASGSELKPCAKRQIILSPAELAASIQRHLALHSCQVVFLATDASFDEIRELNSSLKGTPLLRFDPAALLPRVGAGDAEDARETPLDFSGKPERAIMDTLICAFADAFLATRLSIFSWNILEERIVQGMAAETGRYM